MSPKVFLALVLSCTLAKLRILTPDSISNLKPIYALAAYSNTNLLPIYGRFILIDIEPSCMIPKIENIGPQTIVVLYNAEKFECDFSTLGQIVEKAGSSASLISVNENTISKSFYNLYTDQFIYRPHQSYRLNSPSLLIDENFGQALKNHSDSQIWGTYVHDEIKRTNYPVVKYFMSSDFNIDKIYIEKLSKISNFLGEIWMQELSFYFLSRFDINVEENCYTDRDKMLYCLEETGHITGKIKILNTILILNVFNSLSYSAGVFFMYLQDLYAQCSIDYSLFCHEGILEKYKLPINYADNVLKRSYSGYEIINSVSVNEVYIYSPDKLEELYILSSTLASWNNNCSDSCTYYNINDDKCQIGCNTSECGYDNLVCLETQKCYSFMIGDGNCNDACAEDEDCVDKGDRMMGRILMVVLVPIMGFVIM